MNKLTDVSNNGYSNIHHLHFGPDNKLVVNGTPSNINTGLINKSDENIQSVRINGHELNAFISNLKNKILKLENENNSLKNELQKKEEINNNKVLKLKIQAKNLLDNSKEENKVLQIEKNQLEKENNSLKLENNKLVETKNLIKNSKEENKVLQNEKNQLEKENNSLKLENNKLVEQKNELKEYNAKLKNEKREVSVKKHNELKRKLDLALWVIDQLQENTESITTYEYEFDNKDQTHIPFKKRKFKKIEN